MSEWAAQPDALPLAGAVHCLLQNHKHSAARLQIGGLNIISCPAAPARCPPNHPPAQPPFYVCCAPPPHLQSHLHTAAHRLENGVRLLVDLLLRTPKRKASAGNANEKCAVRHKGWAARCRLCKLIGGRQHGRISMGAPRFSALATRGPVYHF